MTGAMRPLLRLMFEFHRGPKVAVSGDTGAEGTFTDAEVIEIRAASRPLTTRWLMASNKPHSAPETSPMSHKRGVAVLAPPTIEFFDKSNAPKLYHDPDADGRRHRLSPAEIARHSTGRDRSTGRLALGVAVTNRHNGTVRFEADLWKIDLDFHPDAASLLTDRWQRENAAMPRRIQNRMQRHFSRTFLQFDAMREQTDDWKDFLMAVLSDAGSYVGLDHWKGSPR